MSELIPESRVDGDEAVTVVVWDGVEYVPASAAARMVTDADTMHEILKSMKP